MIESVTVTTARNESIVLNLSDPWEFGIGIENIEGIGPGKADVNVTELATTDGSIANSTRLGSRNIVFSLFLLEAPDVETSRHRVYQYFQIKKAITLTFKTNYRTMSISGIVESNEPDIFSEMEKVQVSVICPDPYFYADNAIYRLNGVDQKFYFPFSNESVIDPLINLGEIIYTTGEIVDYVGETDTGVIIKVHMTNTVEDFWIRNNATDVTMSIDTDKIDAIVNDGHHALIENDDLIICTIRSNRYVKLIRAGNTYNVLSAMPKNMQWITLQPGPNAFSYGAADGIAYSEIEIVSYVLYSGI